jgi:proteic killer suppression protein
MIKSFRHKGLEAFYKTGTTKGIQAGHAAKLRLILAVLDAASGPESIAIQAFRSHQLKGPMRDSWSVWVNGNWRVVFRFVDGGVELVDYLDYH